MPINILARTTALIPPFKIRLEEQEAGWDVVIRKDGDTSTIEIGTFPTQADAMKAASERVKAELKQDGKVFPESITWTTTRPLLPPEPIAPMRSREHSWGKTLHDILPLMVGIVASVLLGVLTQIARQPSATSISQASEINKLTTAISDVKQEVEAVRQALRATQSTSSSSGDVLALKSDIEQLKQREALLENALGDGLDKRLAVPMMRKDLDAIKEQYKVDLLAMDSRLTLVVDLMKWFLGFIGLGSVLSALSNWFARPKENKETATSKTTAA